MTKKFFQGLLNQKENIDKNETHMCSLLVFSTDCFFLFFMSD